MPLNIIAKGDREIISELQKKNFNGFELYIRNRSDFHLTRRNILALHFPYALENKKINLSIIDEFSLNILTEAITCAIKNNIPKIIFHTPRVLEEEKEKSIKTFLQNLEQHHNPKVLFCLENTPLWPHLLPNLPLFWQPEDFIKIREQSNIPLGLTIDIEHFAITAVMKPLLQQKLLSQKELLKLIKERSQEPQLEEESHNYILTCIKKLKPFINHIHYCGTDIRQYYNEKQELPMQGEHLPLKFKEIINNQLVQDRLNHVLIMKELKDLNTNIVLEITAKEKNQQIKEIIRSRAYLDKLI